MLASDSNEDAISRYICIISSKPLGKVMPVGCCNAKYLPHGFTLPGYAKGPKMSFYEQGIW